MKVVISYAAADRKWAAELASSLRDQGIEVLEPGRNRISGQKNSHGEVPEAFEAAEAMILLVSPSSIETEQLTHDFQYAIRSERFGDRVIPVIVSRRKKLPWIVNRLSPEEGKPSQVGERIVQRLKLSQTNEKPRTARELLQAIRESGLIGMWKDRADIHDTVEFARGLRRDAEKRGGAA
jgi:hypothetical protein